MYRHVRRRPRIKPGRTAGSRVIVHKRSARLTKDGENDGRKANGGKRARARTQRDGGEDPRHRLFVLSGFRAGVRGVECGRGGRVVFPADGAGADGERGGGFKRRRLVRRGVGGGRRVRAVHAAQNRVGAQRAVPQPFLLPAERAVRAAHHGEVRAARVSVLRGQGDGGRDVPHHRQPHCTAGGRLFQLYAGGDERAERTVGRGVLSHRVGLAGARVRLARAGGDDTRRALRPRSDPRAVGAERGQPPYGGHKRAHAGTRTRCSNCM